MTFSEALDSTPLPAISSFTVVQNGSIAIAVNSVMISGCTVTLGLATAPTATIAVAYIQPSINRLQDLSGNAVGSFDFIAIP